MTGLRGSRACLHCGERLPDPNQRGRRRRYCCGAHRSAARRQRTKEPDPVQETFASVLDEVLKASPHSARALAEAEPVGRFFVSSPTMSQWRWGRAVPYLTEETLDRLLALERRAGAEPGRLVAALHRTVAAGGPADWRWRSAPPDAPTAGPLALKAALEARGATNRCRSTFVTATDEYVVGDDRRPAASRHEYQILALAPGLTSFWVTVAVDDRSPVEVEPVEGCSRGREVRETDAGYGVRAIELRLDRTRDVGELHRLRFTLRNPPHPEIDGIPWSGCLRMIEDAACRRLDMRLGFAAEPRPNEAWRGTWKPGPGGVPEPADQEPVTAEGDWFPLTRTDPRPGSYGFRWRWARADEPYRPIGRGPR